MVSIDVAPEKLSFSEGKGSILGADVDALVNPVNCVGVMGKGLALAFKEAFPDVFREYQRACRAKEILPGRVQVVSTQGPQRTKYVINFPTKRHWRDKSRMEDVEAGLRDLAAQMNERDISTLAIPALGCGLGGLDWTDVRETIIDVLADRVSVKGTMRIVLFEPQ